MQYGGSNVQAFRTYRNIIKNGDMRIGQVGNVQLATGTTAVNTATLGSATPVYNNTDVWGIQGEGALTALLNDSQIDIHPLIDVIGGNLAGFSKQIQITAAQAVIAAGDAFFILNTVDGYSTANLFNNICVLSFWVSSPKPGIHYVSLAVGAGVNVNTFVSSYVINNANTWEYKQISVNFNPPVGVVNFSTNTGIAIAFPLAAGANFRTANLNQWESRFPLNAALSGVNQQNLLDTIGNKFIITDVQLETGFTATPFDRLPFLEELSLCQQFYWNTFPYGKLPANNLGTAWSAVTYWAKTAGISNDGVYVLHPTQMWDSGAPPSIFTYNPAAANSQWRNMTVAGDAGAPTILNSNGGKGFFIRCPQTAGVAVGNQISINLEVISIPPTLWP